ncbi:ankyrin repeat-containing domain protein [Lipomyces kononenkoae]|uniref:Ankyrin repeat-containing domain protein n=1 Tax=Lipomyces kononenkoae TaxID=34357 RepID=A0ACC3SXT4_LIPKO
MTDEQPVDAFPLHTAAHEGRELAVRSLIRSEPSLISKRDDDGRTPLFWAVSAGNADIVQSLLTAAKGPDGQLKRIDIDDTDEAGWTVSHIAASIGSLAILNMLLPYDPDLSIQTSAGQTPLHYAVSRVRHEVAVRLIEKYPGAVRIKDRQNQLPLHRAAAIGNIPLITLLIKNKSPLNTVDRSGWTPLFHAAAEGHGDAALALVRAGADTERLDPDGNIFLNVCPDDKVKKWIQDMIARDL